MKVLDPGHAYTLDWLDGFPGVAGVGSRPHSSLSEAVLIFVKREGDGYPGNVGHHAGTNLQEVVRALIDRLKYLDGQIAHVYNERCINHLRNVLILLECRAAERHGRRVEFNPAHIEEAPTCARCGHIGCNSTCRGHSFGV